jgi:hypothetical protein
LRHPDPAYRNADEAARLAKAAFEMNRGRMPLSLDTLAAAHAEAGKFDEALRTQEQAIALAKEIGDEKLVAELEKRLAPYRDGKPYREDPAAKTPRTPATAPTRPAPVGP